MTHLGVLVLCSLHKTWLLLSSTCRWSCNEDPNFGEGCSVLPNTATVHCSYFNTVDCFILSKGLRISTLYLISFSPAICPVCNYACTLLQEIAWEHLAPCTTACGIRTQLAKEPSQGLFFLAWNDRHFNCNAMSTRLNVSPFFFLTYKSMHFRFYFFFGGKSLAQLPWHCRQNIGASILEWAVPTLC